MRGIFSILSFSILTIFIVIIDRSFLPALEQSYFNFNLLLAFSIYLLVVIDKNLSFTTYTIGTILSALLGATLTVTSLLIGLFILFIMDRIFESFLTNRSYYTLLTLGIAGWSLYYLLFSTMIFLYSLLKQDLLLPVLSSSKVLGFLLSNILLILFLSLFFILTTFLSKKFKSYFIISD